MSLRERIAMRIARFSVGDTVIVYLDGDCELEGVITYIEDHWCKVEAPCGEFTSTLTTARQLKTVDGAIITLPEYAGPWKNEDCTIECGDGVWHVINHVLQCSIAHCDRIEPLKRWIGE